MAEVKISARIRPSTTKHSRHALRTSGRIPAVVYGKGMTSQPIELDARELESAIRRKGRNALMDLVVKGERKDNKYVVMIKDIQKEPVNRVITHIDLCRVSMNDKIHTTVPVAFRGEALGAKNGGIVQHGLRELEVECLPAQIPDALYVDIADLDVGDHLSVADLPQSEGYRVMSDPEAVLVTVVAPRMAEQAEAEGPVIVAAPETGKAEEDKGEKGEEGE